MGVFTVVPKVVPHSVQLDVSAHFSALDDEEFGGGGDAGSLTPRCFATLICCMLV